MQPNQLSGNGKKLFELIEFDDQEQLLYEVRKHPFGLFVIYVTGVLIGALLFAIFAVAGYAVEGDPLNLGVELSNYKSIFLLVGLLLAVLTAIVASIAGYLYKSNVILVTNDKIAQVLYRTLFDRKISQLSIGDAQDVTVTQKGVIARFFNFGTIVVETAGEQQNYTFTYVPDPYQASKTIIMAHEINLKQYGN